MAHAKQYQQTRPDRSRDTAIHGDTRLTDPLYDRPHRKPLMSQLGEFPDKRILIPGRSLGI